MRSPSFRSGCRPPQVPILRMPLHAEHVQLLDHDRGRRAAHSGGLHGDGLPVERAGVAEHPALPVLLLGSVEEVLGDVFGAQRVAGNEARLRVVAFLSSDMYRHAGYRPRQCRAWSSGLARGRSSTFCAARPDRTGLPGGRRRGRGLGRFARCVTDGELVARLPSRREHRPVRARARGPSRSSPHARGHAC